MQLRREDDFMSLIPVPATKGSISHNASSQTEYILQETDSFAL